LPLPPSRSPEGHRQLRAAWETSPALLGGKQKLSKQRRNQTPTKGPIKTIHLFPANCTRLAFVRSILDQSRGGILSRLRDTEVMGRNTKKSREVSLADKIHRKVSATQTPCSHQPCSAQAIKMQVVPLNTACCDTVPLVTRPKKKRNHSLCLKHTARLTTRTRARNNDAWLTARLILNQAICTERLHFIETKTYPAEHFPAHTRPQSSDEQLDLGHRRRREANDRRSLFRSTGRAWNHFSTPPANFYWEIYM